MRDVSIGNLGDEAWKAGDLIEEEHPEYALGPADVEELKDEEDPDFV